MPRPAKDDPRDCFRSFRFTEAEITRLNARARAAGQTLSSYVRDRILDHPEEPEEAAQAAAPWGTERLRRDPKPTRPINQLAARLLAEKLRRVGVNLNQIAHRMTELRLPPPRELTMLLDEIRDYVREARQV